MVFLSPSDIEPSAIFLEDVAEVGVLAIRQIIEAMRSGCLLSELAVLLVVSVHQVPSQEQDDGNQDTVAAQVDRQGLDVARRVAIEEDLGTCGVSGTPREEVHRDADGFLSLSADISCQHRHAETLRRPEGEDDPVGDQETGAGGVVGILNGHDHDCADKGSAVR